MIEPGTIGGILLIFGAFALYRGSLIWSVAIYFAADCAWVVLAFKQQDYFGVTAISIGMVLGLIVWFKAHRGDFVKELHAKHN
jgi:hypothetical protein